tara:strand:+ start:20761 stop:21987 length:1227 start_codon:yes stop_codon:yes gene_type:complete
MHKTKNKILILIDQIAPSTGGFWTVLDIAYSLKDKYEIVFFIAGLNYISTIHNFQTLAKNRIPESKIFVSPFLKKRPKFFFSSKLPYLIIYYIYKFFISVYFLSHKRKIKKYLKNCKVIFISSFISIEDLEKINLSLNPNCIKIQNHAGSLKTLEDFSKTLNNKMIPDSNSYLNYLSILDKIIFQSKMQKLKVDKKYPSLKNKTFAFLPSINESDLLKGKLDNYPFHDKNFFNIVYVATIQERKRQKLCLEIIKKVLIKDLNVSLYFIGSYKHSDSYYVELQKMIRNMNLQDNVFFTGYAKEFANYMWHSDVIIHPSSAEGVPRVLREALFMGKTIIASNLDGNRDLFGKYNSAILIDYPSPNLYADAILSIKNNPNLRLSYEKKARISYDNQLSFDIYKKNIISIFD